MSQLLRPDVLFVSVILPVYLMIGGWLIAKFHDRWIRKEIARERAASEREARNHQ